MDAFTEKAAGLYQSGMSLKDVAIAMGSGPAWVSQKLRRAGVPPKKNTKNLWTAEEDAALKAHYMLSNEEVVALIKTRTLSAVRNRRKTLGLEKFPDRKPKQWTDEDFKFITDNADKTSYELSKNFGVHESSIACIRSRKGIYKKYFCRVCGTGISQQGEYCKEHKIIARQMRSYTSKAVGKGREFALSTDDTYKLLMARCTYCGGPGYGIDRIDSSKGYIEGNVNPCCSRCNAMKNDMTVADFEAHIQRIAAHIKEKA